MNTNKKNIEDSKIPQEQVNLKKEPKVSFSYDEDVQTLKPSDFFSVVSKRELSSEAIWISFSENLKTIINGFEKVIKMMEKYPKQLFNECFDIANPEEGHKQLFRFYINIVQFKLFAEALSREKQTISTLIPNMRFFQHHLFSFWKKQQILT